MEVRDFYAYKININSSGSDYESNINLESQCIAEFLGKWVVDFSGVGWLPGSSTKSRWCPFWSVESVIFGDWGWCNGHLPGLQGFGAHLNPAVTIALWLFACFDKRKVIPFIVSQVAGAFCAAALVYGLYYNLFFDFEQTHHIVRGSVESVDLAGTFSTYPNPHINFVQAFAVEMVITAILMGLILALTDDGNGVPRGPLAPLLIGLLIAVIGASMGPLTGFAMNPARDFGPKVFAWLAGWGNVAFTGGRDIPYFLVPLFGPIVGAIVGAFAYRKLIGRHLPCDICVVEEKETTTPSEQKASL